MIQVGLAVTSEQSTLVAIERSGLPTLVGATVLGVGHQSPEAQQAAAIKEFLRQLGRGPKQVVFSQPGEHAQFVYGRLPKVDSASRSDLARYRLKDRIQDIEKCALAVSVVRTSLEAEDEDVLVIASPKASVEVRAQMLQDAGIEVAGCETDAQAMLRVLWNDRASHGQSLQTMAFTLVNIGLHTTRFVVVQDNTIRFIRSVKFGIDHLVKHLSAQTELSEGAIFNAVRSGRARLLTDFRLEMTEGDSTWLLDASAAFEGLLGELRRLMNYYRSMSRGRSHGGILDQLVLSGELVALDGFTSWIGKTLGIRVHALNPFSGIAMDVSPETYHLVNQNPYRFIVAAGLALSPYGLPEAQTNKYGSTSSPQLARI